MITSGHLWGQGFMRLFFLPGPVVPAQTWRWKSSCFLRSFGEVLEILIGVFKCHLLYSTDQSSAHSCAGPLYLCLTCLWYRCGLKSGSSGSSGNLITAFCWAEPSRQPVLYLHKVVSWAHVLQMVASVLFSCQLCPGGLAVSAVFNPARISYS